MESTTLAPLIAKLSRWSPLDEAARQALLSLPNRVVEYDRRSLIVREGERLTHYGLLLSGFAHCHTVTGGGARQILSVHVRGDMLALSGAAEIAPCNVQPLSPVKVALIPRSALFSAAAYFPSIARALWADTGVNASVLAQWLLNVGCRDARSRVSHLLCELAVRQEMAGVCSGPDYEWPMTQEQLGEATGLTAVHINRTMQALRNEGLIRTNGRQVIVLDWDRLCEAGDFVPNYLQAAG